MFLIILSMIYFESKGITVTAERFEHLPYRIEVIEVEDMLTINELDEILEKEAGVKINANGDPGSLSQASVRGNAPKHTLIMLNGHRINDPKTGGFDLSAIPLNAVKRIEIIKGSSSVFQGSNAIGGIVNLITGNETNTIKIEGNTNSSFGTNIQLYKSVVNANLNLKKGNGQRSNTDYEQYSMGINWNDGIIINPAITGELIKYNYKYSDYWTGDEIIQNDEYKSAVSQFNTKFLYKMLSLSINLEKDKIWIDQFTSNYDTTFLFGEEKIGVSLSLFHETTNINTFASARVDWHGSFGLHPSFTIGSRITKPIEIFASIGSAFQAPTLYDLYYPGFSNDELTPEYSIALNGGIKIKNFTISGYLKEIRDRIALDDTWIPQNIAKSRIYGIDVEANGNYEDLSYSLIYSYLDGYDEEDGAKRELQHQPKHSITGVLSYKGPITTEISGKWYGERKKWFSFGGWKIEDPAFIIDLGISKTFNDFSLGFTVENLLNTEYIASFGSSYTDRDYPGMGRHLNIWSKYAF
ncbi:MAG: TonB-dependent receptor [candidate division WOR-3 bacterium]